MTLSRRRLNLPRQSALRQDVARGISEAPHPVAGTRLCEDGNLLVEESSSVGRGTIVPYQRHCGRRSRRRRQASADATQLDGGRPPQSFLPGEPSRRAAILRSSTVMGLARTADGPKLHDFASHLSVNGLFGYVHHEIEFRRAERIPILTGVNGSGKTHVLNLLRSLVAFDVAALTTVPCSSAMLSYESGKALSFEQLEPNVVRLEGTTVHRDFGVIVIRVSRDPLEDIVPPYMERLDDDLWLDQTDGEIVSHSVLMARLGVPHRSQRLRPNARRCEPARTRIVGVEDGVPSRCDADPCRDTATGHASPLRFDLFDMAAYDRLAAYASTWMKSVNELAGDFATRANGVRPIRREASVPQPFQAGGVVGVVVHELPCASACSPRRSSTRTSGAATTRRSGRGTTTDGSTTPKASTSWATFTPTPSKAFGRW
jgi:hypothetical protein